MLLSMDVRCCCRALWRVMKWGWGRGVEGCVVWGVACGFFFLFRLEGLGGVSVCGFGGMHARKVWRAAWSRCSAAVSRCVLNVAVRGMSVGEVVWSELMLGLRELSCTLARQRRKDACASWSSAWTGLDRAAGWRLVYSVFLDIVEGCGGGAVASNWGWVASVGSGVGSSSCVCLSQCVGLVVTGML